MSQTMQVLRPVDRFNRTLRAALLLAGGSLLSPVVYAQVGDCDVAITQEEVDFGALDRVTVQPKQGRWPLGERSIGVVLSCAQADDLALWYRGSVADALQYSLGGDGRYVLSATEAEIDGQQVELGLANSRGETPSDSARTLAWTPGRLLMPMRAGRVVQGKALTLRVNITATGEDAGLRTGDAVNWEERALVESAASSRAASLHLMAKADPVACVPTFANDGQVDLGEFTTQSLSATGRTRLPEKTLGLSIQCDAPIRIALQMVDEREGTAITTSSIFFGLNRDSAGNNIGLYELKVDPTLTRMDNHPAVYATVSTTNGVAWAPSQSGLTNISKNALLGFTTLPGNIQGPIALQSLSTQVTVMPVIAPMNDLNTSQAITLDGRATLEIKYP